MKGFLSSLLAADETKNDFELAQVINKIKVPLNYAVMGLLAMIAVGAIFFAVYVAFRLAKAEDEGKRKEAKKQLLWSLIAVFAAVAVFTLINVVFDSAFFGSIEKRLPPIAEGEEGYYVVEAVNAVLGAIAEAVSALLALGTIAGILFGIYLGFRLATAEDEGKRKEAKNQLLWTLIAVVSVFVLMTLINTVMWKILIDAIETQQTPTT